jgi:hypothetical protein
MPSQGVTIGLLFARWHWCGFLITLVIVSGIEVHADADLLGWQGAAHNSGTDRWVVHGQVQGIFTDGQGWLKLCSLSVFNAASPLPPHFGLPEGQCLVNQN